LDQLGLYPPAMDSAYRAKLLVVGAHDWKNRLAAFSNHGDLVDILAPGCAIPIKDNDNNVSYVSGTSFAAPFVASTAALLAASNLGPDEIKTRIVVSGDFDAQLAHKVKYAVRLNVERAIRLKDDSIVLDSVDKLSRQLLFGELQDGQTWTCKIANEDRAFNAQQVYKVIPAFPISATQSVFRVLARQVDSADVTDVDCDEPFVESLQFKGPRDSAFESYDWSRIIELVPRWQAIR